MSGDTHSWTLNPVPHFGNQVQYKTEKQREREFYQERMEELEDD